MRISRRRVTRLFRSVRRRVWELAGSERFSRPALYGLDHKLEPYLPSRGFFVEAGANDGFHESNTYYLERFRGWSGLLVEPIPELFRDCLRTRRASRVVNCALVGSNYESQTIELVYGDLLSQVAHRLSEDAKRQLEGVAQRIHLKTYSVTVPARTISSLIDEVGGARVDFMSLDVEGYEAEVLDGLDQSRHRPRLILVECLSPSARAAVDSKLREHYAAAVKLSPVDCLFISKD